MERSKIWLPATGSGGARFERGRFTLQCYDLSGGLIGVLSGLKLGGTNRKATKAVKTVKASVKYQK